MDGMIHLGRPRSIEEPRSGSLTVKGRCRLPGSRNDLIRPHPDDVDAFLTGLLARDDEALARRSWFVVRFVGRTVVDWSRRGGSRHGIWNRSALRRAKATRTTGLSQSYTASS